jgi:23S rRNA maturation-related 3'-5' exoribonuclease YhaM
MLKDIEGPNQKACLRLLEENRRLFQTVQGSTNNHQNWPGGYFDHVQEIMNIAEVLYWQLNSLRRLPFSLSDVLLIVYLHDIEKPWKYERRGDGQLYCKRGFDTKAKSHAFRKRKLKQYGITLTRDQQNALQYVEGELADYSSRRRVMNPLATLCHMADVASARIWFDHPWIDDDEWGSASRIRH